MKPDREGTVSLTNQPVLDGLCSQRHPFKHVRWSDNVDTRKIDDTGQIASGIKDRRSRADEFFYGMEKMLPICDAHCFPLDNDASRRSCTDLIFAKTLSGCVDQLQRGREDGMCDGFNHHSRCVGAQDAPFRLLDGSE